MALYSVPAVSQQHNALATGGIGEAHLKPFVRLYPLGYEYFHKIKKSQPIKYTSLFWDGQIKRLKMWAKSADIGASMGVLA